MRFTWVILGSILCTIFVFGIGHNDLRLAVVLVLLVVVAIKDQVQRVWWYRPFFSAWLGTSFIISDRLQISAGGHSEPVFATFGPGLLIIAAYQIIRHMSIRKQSAIEKQS